MSWELEYSKDADKFLSKNKQLEKSLKDALRKFIQYLDGNTVSADIKKMSGQWEGYYRIRKGDIRIILSFNRPNSSLYVEKIDFRGNIYSK